MAHPAGLAGLAFSVAESAAQLVRLGAAKAVARAPEVGGARLIRHVAQHAANFSLHDFAECLAAELEVIALLIDRVAAVTLNQDAALDASHQLLERRLLRGRLERHVRHAWKRDALPRRAVQTAVRALFPDERRQLTGGLPVDEHALLDEIPALPWHTLVVVPDGGQPGRLRAIGDEVHDWRPDAYLADGIGREEAGAGVVGLPTERAIELRGMADRLVNRQPEV